MKSKECVKFHLLVSYIFTLFKVKIDAATKYVPTENIIKGRTWMEATQGGVNYVILWERPMFSSGPFPAYNDDNYYLLLLLHRAKIPKSKFRGRRYFVTAWYKLP